MGSPGVGGASVRRARMEDAGLARADASALPEGTAILDTMLAVFTLHEIRNVPAREEFFRATARALAPGGRLLVVEHLRDWRNFLVYGPGFLHFLSGSQWRRCASLAALELEREIAVTPFVRVFVWRTPTRTSGQS
jgi:ubiquinone/menaquinone biosynthesis C-methylase UbiE